MIQVIKRPMPGGPVFVAFANAGIGFVNRGGEVSLEIEAEGSTPAEAVKSLLRYVALETADFEKAFPK